MSGVTLYVGAPGTGKTTAALQELQAIPLPKVILDLGGSKVLRHFPETKAFPRGPLPNSPIRFVPERVEDLDALYDKIWHRGNLALLVDDVMALPSARGLARLCRLWRPRNLRILATTHHVSGDFGQGVMACDPLIVAFKTTAPRSLEWLEKHHGVAPDELRNLGLGEALELSF